MKRKEAPQTWNKCLRNAFPKFWASLKHESSIIPREFLVLSLLPLSYDISQFTKEAYVIQVNPSKHFLRSLSISPFAKKWYKQPRNYWALALRRLAFSVSRANGVLRFTRWNFSAGGRQGGRQFYVALMGKLSLNWWFLENRGSKKKIEENDFYPRYLFFNFSSDSTMFYFFHAKNIKLYPFDRKLQDEWKLFPSIFHLESQFSINPFWNENAP